MANEGTAIDVLFRLVCWTIDGTGFPLVLFSFTSAIYLSKRTPMGTHELWIWQAPQKTCTFAKGGPDRPELLGRGRRQNLSGYPTDADPRVEINPHESWYRSFIPRSIRFLVILCGV